MTPWLRWRAWANSSISPWARGSPNSQAAAAVSRRFAMSAPAYQLLTFQGAADDYDEAAVADFDAVAREAWPTSCRRLSRGWTRSAST
jgi:hypothetical protein